MSGSRPEGGPEVPGLTDALRKIPSSGIHIHVLSFEKYLAQVHKHETSYEKSLHRYTYT